MYFLLLQRLPVPDKLYSQKITLPTSRQRYSCLNVRKLSYSLPARRISNRLRYFGQSLNIERILDIVVRLATSHSQVLSCVVGTVSSQNLNFTKFYSLAILEL